MHPRQDYPREAHGYPFSYTHAKRIGNHAPRYLDPEWLSDRIDLIFDRCRGPFNAVLARARKEIEEATIDAMRIDRDAGPCARLHGSLP